MIRTVMFDVDDTIYNFHFANECATEKLAAYTAEQFGWDREEFLDRQKKAMADIRRYAGTSGGYRTRLLRYQNILEAAGLPIYPHALAMCNIYRETLLDYLIPEPGVEEWMRFLKEKEIRIGVASDATAHQQFEKLERLGLLSYVDFMVTSEEAGVEKPDVKFFERCNEKSLCRPDEVMFIGDNPEKDYYGAKVAGYHTVWYNPLCKSNDAIKYVLHHYADAPAMFEEFNLLNNMGDNEE